MASELLKTKALAARIKEPKVRDFDFGLNLTSVESLIPDLPQPKPQQLLDIQEDNRKGRLRDSLNKIGGRLEDTSLDFIKRENFSVKGNVSLSKGTPSIVDDLKFQEEVQKLRNQKTPVKKIAEKLGTSVATIERTIKKIGEAGKATKDVVAQEKLKQAYEKFVKETGEIPRIQDMRNAGLSQEAIVRAQRDGIEFGRRGEGKGSAKAKIVNEDLIEMSKNKKILAALNNEIIPNVNEVIKVTSATDEASALNRLVQFSDAITEGRKGLDLKLDKYKKGANFILDNADVLNEQIREIAEKSIGASVGEQSIKNPRKDISRQKLLTGYNVDEPAGVMSSYRRGSQPYGIFSQAIGADLNVGDKLSFDVFKSIKEKEIQMAKGNERVKKINEFNRGVAKYEKLLNQDRKPGELKVKLFRASMKNPSKTVSRFSQLPKEYQKAFTDNYKKLGYSFEVPKDMKTIFEMREDIKNPVIAKQIKDRIKSGAARLYAGVPIDDYIESITEDIKAGRKGKAALKTLGPIGVGATGYFAQDEFRKGEPALDIGVSAVTGIKPTELLLRKIVPEEKGGYTDEEKLARAQLKLLKATKDYKPTSLDFGKIGTVAAKDPDYEGAPGLYLDYLRDKQDEVESIALPAEERFQEEVMQPFFERKSQERSVITEGLGNLIDYVKTQSFPGQIERIDFSNGSDGTALAIEESLEAFQRYLKAGGKLSYKDFIALGNEGVSKFFNSGGRVGFKDGPKNPGRRTFMKLAAGIASIPIFGKFFKPAAPLVKKLANSNTVMPDWFPNFVDKFVGRSIGKKIDADLIEYTNPDLPNIKLTRKDDGSILVEGKNDFNEAYNISYEPPGYELIDETTGKAVKTKGEFEAVEGRHVALGPEDYDTDAFYADDLDELYTRDIADMEKYTTGDVTNTAKDAFGRDTGLKKGMYDSDMAQGRAENQADILADEGLDEID